MKTTGAILIFLLLWTVSCKKESFITSPDARVIISADTLHYDTVFTGAGSTYRAFTIINDNNQKLRLSSIRLMGGASSNFKMNVDGLSGTVFSNVELEANDSVYVFVQVNVDPASGALPFVIRDSIEISFNGNDRLVQLEAWGQNAHFYRDRVISVNETWNNDLPYVILGSLQVAANTTLTINSGCRIYVNANAPITIDGTLKVNGMKDSLDRVYFMGDRLDDPYKYYPAAWPGLYFRAGSRDNDLTYAVLKNAYQAIGVEDPSVNANPKVTLYECIIDNAYAAGIIAVNSRVSARNCQITNCGQNLVLVKGGFYDFNHCTVATWSNRYIDHKEPVLLLTNFLVANNVVTENPLTANFTNCIFWGENGTPPDEVVVLKSGSTPFNVNFDHGIWKVQSVPSNINPPISMIANQPPLFNTINTSDNLYDFRLAAGSPALNAGRATSASIDLDGNPRSVGLPDLGCYEKQ